MMMRLIASRPWHLIRWIHRRVRFVVWHLVDQGLGVRTAFFESTVLFERDGPEFTEKPCGWLTLYRVLRWLDATPGDVIVDFGSGAGRALLVASLFPFRRVVGVERRESLHRRAQDNLAHFRLPRLAPVELVCMDATEYQLPDDVTVVFFYNPFGGQTFRHVMKGVFASVDRVPRRLKVVYVNPQEHAYLVGTGRCRWVKTLMKGLRPTPEWARMLAAYVYEVEPTPPEPGSEPVSKLRLCRLTGIIHEA